MENSHPNQSVIITGMHRSGTSLTASLLHSAGIEIGDRLMLPSEWNPKGFFEDWDFVELHQAILRSQGISPEGWTKEKLVEVQGQYLAAAQNLILARKNKPIWGWKDPRTTLFLDFWLKLIPEAKFIFIFRSPWEVVDSLFRRGDFIFDTNPNFAVEQWSIYNRAILDFYERWHNQCLLLDIRSIISNPDVIINLIKQKFQLELHSPESLYEKSQFTVDSNIYYRQAMITKLFPKVIDLYNQLQQRADEGVSSTLENQHLDLTYESWFLQDWHDLKQVLNEKHQLENEKHQLENEKHQLENEKHQLETHLAQSQANETLLVQEKQQLQKAEILLTQQLHQSDKQLQIAQKQLQQLKNLLLAMESSKFWKLRRWWFHLKQKFNIVEVDSVYQNYLSSVNEQPLIEQSDPINFTDETPAKH